jgi:hypothetical protein
VAEKKEDMELVVGSGMSALYWAHDEHGKGEYGRVFVAADTGVMYFKSLTEINKEREAKNATQSTA